MATELFVDELLLLGLATLGAIIEEVLKIGDVLLLAALAAIRAAYSLDRFISVFLALSSLATLAFCFLDIRPNLTAIKYLKN